MVLLGGLYSYVAPGAACSMRAHREYASSGGVAGTNNVPPIGLSWACGPAARQQTEEHWRRSALAAGMPWRRLCRPTGRRENAISVVAGGSKAERQCRHVQASIGRSFSMAGCSLGGVCQLVPRQEWVNRAGMY